jgi:hypothetical protein
VHTYEERVVKKIPTNKIQLEYNKFTFRTLPRDTFQSTSEVPKVETGTLKAVCSLQKYEETQWTRGQSKEIIAQTHQLDGDLLAGLHSRTCNSQRDHQSHRKGDSFRIKTQLLSPATEQTEEDLPEGAAPELAPEAVLVANARFHRRGAPQGRVVS